NKPLARVLIVDDSVEDRQLYQRLLGQDQWEFLEAKTGQDGLALFREHRPDCVLLDYLLPDLDGLEFLAHLSETTGARQVPVIMLTVQGNESVVAQAFKHGVEDCLTKNDLSAERLRRAI